MGILADAHQNTWFHGPLKGTGHRDGLADLLLYVLLRPELFEAQRLAEELGVAHIRAKVDTPRKTV